MKKLLFNRDLKFDNHFYKRLYSSLKWIIEKFCYLELKIFLKDLEFSYLVSKFSD